MRSSSHSFLRKEIWKSFLAQKLFYRHRLRIKIAITDIPFLFDEFIQQLINIPCIMISAARLPIYKILQQIIRKILQIFRIVSLQPDDGIA